MAATATGTQQLTALAVGVRGVRPRTSAGAAHTAATLDLPTRRTDPHRVKFTGLAQRLGQLEAVYRDLQSKYWANLKNLGQHCNFYAHERDLSGPRIYFPYTFAVMNIYWGPKNSSWGSESRGWGARRSLSHGSGLAAGRGCH